jgi:hypothetical protein
VLGDEVLRELFGSEKDDDVGGLGYYMRKSVIYTDYLVLLG